MFYKISSFISSLNQRIQIGRFIGFSLVLFIVSVVLFRGIDLIHPPTLVKANPLVTNWIGAVDGDWDTAGNWDNGVLDGTKNAFIQLLGGTDVTVSGAFFNALS